MTQNKFNPEDLKKLIGFGIEYSGDMANPSGSGAITDAALSAWGLDLTVTLEDGRVMHMNELDLLPQRGNRFELRQDLMHGLPYLTQLMTAVTMRKARESAAKTDQANRFAATVERIKIENPKLEIGQGMKVGASNLKRQLRTAFPGVKFSVRCDSSSIRVRWTDGPAFDAVEQIANAYTQGSFDGMTDCYEFAHSPWTETFGGARYVFCNRDHSDALLQRSIAELVVQYGDYNTPSVEDFKAGRSYNVSPILNASNRDSWQELIHRRASELAC